MFKHQFIERATEVTWMLLLVSFWLFVDLWFRIFHSISVLEISNKWVKNSFDISDGVGIIVTYSLFMAGVLPGVRFVLPLFLSIAYLQICSWLNMKVKHSSNEYWKSYYIEEDKIKYKAIETNNSTLWNAYNEHIQTKNSIIKQQTVCQSIVMITAIGFFIPENTTYFLQFAFEKLEQLSWYIDYPLRSLLGGFLLFVGMIGFSKLEHLNYMSVKVSEAAEKHN